MSKKQKKYFVCAATKENLNRFYVCVSKPALSSYCPCLPACDSYCPSLRGYLTRCFIGRICSEIIYDNHLKLILESMPDNRHIVYTMYEIKSNFSNGYTIKNYVDKLFKDHIFKNHLCECIIEQIKSLMLLCNVYSKIENIIKKAINCYRTLYNNYFEPTVMESSDISKSALSQLSSLLEPVDYLHNCNFGELINKIQQLNSDRLAVNMFNFTFDEISPWRIYEYTNSSDAVGGIAYELKIDLDKFFKKEFLL